MGGGLCAALGLPSPGDAWYFSGVQHGKSPRIGRFHHVALFFRRLPVIEVCHAADWYGNHNSVADKELPAVVKKLLSWRRKNHLSQRGAVEIMQARNFDVSLSTLQNWERSARKPGRIVSNALQEFLEENPKIDNPPRYAPGPKPGQKPRK